MRASGRPTNSTACCVAMASGSASGSDRAAFRWLIGGGRRVNLRDSLAEESEVYHFTFTAGKPEMIRPPITIAALFLFIVSAARGADFTVINTDDSGPGSLREAILDANANPGADRILFNIPGTGVHKIVIGGPTNSNLPVLGTALPEITDPVTIDGYSQPGSHPNTRLNGDDAVI